MAERISLKMFVVGQEGSTIISASPSSTMRQVAQTIFGQPEHIVIRYQFSTNGRRIDSSLTLEQSGFTGGEDVYCVKLPKARKPVIYLLSPEAIEASVTLSLIPEWRFSSIYPIVPIQRSTHDSKEEITWRVQVHPGGELTELITGLNVAYLFWEAQSVFLNFKVLPRLDLIFWFLDHNILHQYLHLPHRFLQRLRKIDLKYLIRPRLPSTTGILS